MLPRTLETAVGDDVTFSLPRLPTELFSGDSISLPLSGLFNVEPAKMRTFSTVSSDLALASVTVGQGRVAIQTTPGPGP